MTRDKHLRYQPPMGVEIAEGGSPGGCGNVDVCHGGATTTLEEVDAGLSMSSKRGRTGGDTRERVEKVLKEAVDELDRESQGNEEDPSIGRLSQEAEVFALQAMHTALLKKLSEVGPSLADLTRENRMLRRVLEEGGISRDELRSQVEAAVVKAMRARPKAVPSTVETAVIAAAALGKNQHSPVDAMNDILKLYRYCPPSTP